VFDAIDNTAAGGVVCLTGVSPAGRSITIDAGALNTEIVLENDAIFGSVNANRRHYEQGAEAMGRADPGWLERLITRRVPLDRWDEALRRERGDVKVVLEFAG
jgi:glucose 1-dehydrogenase